MNKKRILIISGIIFAVLISTLFMSYGFITSRISGNESSKKAVYSAQIIKVEYSDGNETITSNQGAFTPGSTITKTFTIKNTGNVSVKYSINLDEVVNNFERKNDITYELYSNDVLLKNGMYDAKGIFPSDKLTILNKNILSVGESKNYTLKINYLNSEENQIVDSGKNLSAIISIDESKINVNSFIVYGNSKQNGEPSLENPIEIESLGNKTKNILPINTNYSHAIGNLNLTIENDIITLDGSYNSNSQFGFYLDNGELKIINGVVGYERDTSNFMTLNPGTYTMSLKYLGGTIERQSGSNVGGYFGLYTYRNGERLFDTRKNFTMSDYSHSFTVNEDTEAQFFVLQFLGLNNKVTFDNYKIKVQLEEGSTATEYEPFGYKIPINIRGKNILTNTNNTRVGDTTKINDEGSYYMVQTATNTGGMGWYVNYDLNVGDKISAQAKVEYISTAGLKDSVTLRLWNATKKKWIHGGANGVAYSFSTVTVGETKVLKLNGVTLTSDNYSKGDLIELRVTRGMASGSTGNNIINFKLYKDTIMVEKSNTSTDYTPYFEPILTNVYLNEPLRKVGDYVDYIDFANGTLYRNVNAVVLDGVTNSRKVISVSTHNNKYFAILEIAKSINGDKAVLLNTHFKSLPNVTEGNSYITNYGKYCVMVHANQNLNTVNLWNDWLSEQHSFGMPVAINYALSESVPYNIDVPNVNCPSSACIVEVCSNNGVCASNTEVEYDE